MKIHRKTETIRLLPSEVFDDNSHANKQAFSQGPL